MAYAEKGLSKVSNLNSVAGGATTRQMWVYDGVADAVGLIDDAGYFNAARGFLKVGDIILVLASDGFRYAKVATVPATGNVTTTLFAAVAAA